VDIILIYAFFEQSNAFLDFLQSSCEFLYLVLVLVSFFEQFGYGFVGGFVLA
jgi:hypothetical protein